LRRDFQLTLEGPAGTKVVDNFSYWNQQSADVLEAEALRISYHLADSSSRFHQRQVVHFG